MDTNSKGKPRKAIQHGENKSIPEYENHLQMINNYEYNLAK
jgi:hypothetical protein